MPALAGYFERWWQMPGIDGCETVRRLREYEKTHSISRIPVIAVTTHAMTRVSEECLDAGMDDFLAKPINSKALRKLLEQFESRSGRGGAH